jgi:hypothetical protein
MPDVPNLPQTEAAIIEMTNAFRAENHLSAVAENAALKAAAQSFADYLARSGTFSHTADGRQPSDRARASGYRYCMVAENLALNQSSRGFEARDLAGRMVDGWKNSPPHRASMLEPNVTEIGIGIAKGPDADPKYLTVQLFGRPDSFKYEVHVENRSGAAVTYLFGSQNSTAEDRMHITHTACVPHEITFDIGRVTSKFLTGEGAAFVIVRGADGKPRVERQVAAAPLTAKALKAAR